MSNDNGKDTLKAVGHELRESVIQADYHESRSENKLRIANVVSWRTKQNNVMKIRRMTASQLETINDIKRNVLDKLVWADAYTIDYIFSYRDADDVLVYVTRRLGGVGQTTDGIVYGMGASMTAQVKSALGENQANMTRSVATLHKAWSLANTSNPTDDNLFSCGLVGTHSTRERDLLMYDGTLKPSTEQESVTA